MLRTMLICAGVLGLTLGCTTPQHRPEAQKTAAVAQPCDMVTGSHLRHEGGQCSASPGRTYSEDDIRNTGQTDLGQALKMLDPSISTHH